MTGIDGNNPVETDLDEDWLNDVTVLRPPAPAEDAEESDEVLDPQPLLARSGEADRSVAAASVASGGQRACGVCGAVLPDGAGVCGVCGTAIAGPETAAAVEHRPDAASVLVKREDPAEPVSAAAPVRADGRRVYSTVPLQEPAASPTVPVTEDAPAPDLPKAPVAPRRRRSRGVLVVGVAAAGVLLAGVVFVSAITQASSTGQGAVADTGPVASPTPTVAPVLPGFESLPAWSWTGTVDDAVLSQDGSLVAVTGEGTTTVVNEDGDVSAPVPAGTVFSVDIDGVSSLVLAGTSEVAVWQNGLLEPSRVSIPAGESVYARAGALFASTSSTAGSVDLLTSAGFVRYTSPRPGAVPLGAGIGGGVVWASSKGDAVTGSQVGTTVSSTPMAAPADGARILHWLACSIGRVLVQWQLPDGTVRLVAHDLVTGKVLGSETVPAEVELVWNQTATKVMAGPVVVTLSDGSMTVPDPAFVPVTGYGEGFFGATGPTPAVLTGSTVTPLTGNGQAIPVGLIGAGDLLARTPGSIAAYTLTPMSSPSSTAEPGKK